MIIDAREFLRYLRWRLGEPFAVKTELLDKMLHTFGTDPVVVNDDGQLRSLGDRGKPGDL